jgi:hypothetical protein
MKQESTHGHEFDIDLEEGGNYKIDINQELNFKDKKNILKLQYDLWQDFSKNEAFSTEEK